MPRLGAAWHQRDSRRVTAELTERADQPGPDPGEFERHLGYPLAPNLDIDRLRSSIGRWRDDLRAAGMLAGDIAPAAAQLRLAAGHDAVLPQFLGRAGSLEQLENLVLLENRIWLLPLGFPGLLGSSRVLVDQAVQDGFSADALGAEAGCCRAGSVVLAAGGVLADGLVRAGVL